MLRERGDTLHGGTELPETVQGIIAARLDGLDLEAKALLQDAAVVGKVFWLGAVVAIGDRDRHDAERRLHELERRQLLRRERRSSVGGEVEYAFWHVLVRDVAYGQIPRATRAQRHHATAEWIASLAADRFADRADLLAHHDLSALELLRATGSDTSELEGAARHALWAAGDRALELNSFASAMRYFDEALELWPEDDPERPHVLFGHGRAHWAGAASGQGSIEAARDGFVAVGALEDAAAAETVLGEMAWMHGRPAEALPHVERAAGMLADRQLSYAKAYAQTNLGRYFMLAGRNGEAARVSLEALAMAKELGHEELQAAALNHIGTSRVNLGDRGGVEDLERSIEISERISSPELTRGYINLASCVGGLGDLRRCRELHRRGLEVGQRFGQALALRFLEAELGIDAYWAGDWDETLERAERFIREVQAGNPHYMEAGARVTRALLSLARDDVALALSDAERLVAVGRENGEPQSMLPSLSTAAFVFADAGRADAADALVEELLRDHVGETAVAYWVIPAFLTIERRGRSDELVAALEPVEGRFPWVDAPLAFLRGDLARGADALDEFGERPAAAHARLRAAERLAAEGRRAEADAQLARAVAFFRSVRAVRHLRRAEQLLAAAS